MTARVLVVDDIAANVKLLEARLSAEYFTVLTANSPGDALAILREEHVDVVLLDVMMPGMDGFEVCRRIKSAPKTMHVPVIMVSALDQASDKVQGLEAGADDFLTKPVDDIALITRVKNLTRLKSLNDELMRRAATGNDIGTLSLAAADREIAATPAHVLLVEDIGLVARRMVSALGGAHEVDVEPDLPMALLRATTKPYDVLIVSLSLADGDGLRLCSQVRSFERTRNLPIIMLVQPGDETRLLRGLDMGVNDYLTRPIDRNELVARARTQIRRKRHADHLRDRLDESVEFAITDALTGLHNRRYMERHLTALADQAKAVGRPLSVLIADIDHFKSVNDTYGHAAGDNVLREFAARFRRYTRGIDLACRVGGEEFIIIMPETTLEQALQAGERLCDCISGELFRANRETRLRVTASVGIATLEPSDDGADALLKRADGALYAAKKNGRNRVVVDAA
jgi:two-component system, cell cycle response regulator